MESLEYEKLGVKIGFELHQQLNTKKLFCACSSEMRENNLVYEVRRRLRPVFSELGEIDRAALFEFFRNREFIYYGYEDECCLVDLDEEPPHEINREALEIAIDIAHNLDLWIPHELHIMRKIVLDGSAITSFQRTLLVGLGPAKFNEIRIKSLCLEEDSAKPIKQEGKYVYYSLSRLGIPLIEIGTEPDIKTIEDAKNIAKDLGIFLRSFNVKRGIGSIRQDVNVSIARGARVEIKGWQDLRSLHKLIENEIKRQVSLLEIKEELRNNEINTKIEETEGKFILVVKNFEKFAQRILCEKKRLIDELLDYGRVYTCDIYSNFSYDEKYKEVISKIEKNIGIEANDIIFVAYGLEARRAIEEIKNRINYLRIGVPEETRKPNENATTSYARPLPGSARMYPETDLLPIANLPKPKRIKSLLEKKKEIEKVVGEEIAEQLVTSRYFPLFEKITGNKSERTIRIASITFTSTFTELRREGIDVEKIDEKELEKIFDAVEKGNISKKAIRDIIIELAHENDFEEIKKKYELMPIEEIRRIIKETIINTNERDVKKLLGAVMSKVKNKAESEIVEEEIKKYLKEANK
ncbi:MAG: Glu-tRNA(Gln) amidotransferase subunit GatE [Candidatus Aenigmatarchaeota archaeon]